MSEVYLEQEGDHSQTVLVVDSHFLAAVILLIVNQVHLHRKAGIIRSLQQSILVQHAELCKHGID